MHFNGSKLADAHFFFLASHESPFFVLLERNQVVGCLLDEFLGVKDLHFSSTLRLEQKVEARLKAEARLLPLNCELQLAHLWRNWLQKGFFLLSITLETLNEFHQLLRVERWELERIQIGCL